MVTSSEAVEVDEVSAIGPGMVLGGRYRLQHLLGEGGMGRVFLADDEQEGGQVAVKVLADDRPIPKAAERFEREAQSIARIDHDNVVKVSHVGQGPRGGLYYVMEHLEGEELATTLEREGPMPWWRVQHIGRQICGALQATHEAGVVHRDLKLENCFRVTRGDDPDFIKILDFGVAKLLGPPIDQGGRLTNTGATLGTPVYMAPELCRGKHVDHRVDVYALGVMLYELLAGAPPFAGESFLDVALQHMNDPPPPLSGRVLPEELPSGLEELVMRALAKHREDRFPTMAAMARALKRVGEDDPAALGPAISEPVIPIIVAGGTQPAFVSADDWSQPAVGRTESPSAEPQGRAMSADDWGVVSGRTAVASVETSISSFPKIQPLAPSGARSGARWALVGAGVVLVLAGLLAWRLSATTEVPEPEPAVVPAPAVVPETAVQPRTDQASDVVVEVEPTAAGAGVGAKVEPDMVEPDMAEPDMVEPDPGKSEVRRQQDGLSRAQIDGALQRIKPRISTCAGGLTGAQTGDRVRVTLKVDRATGRVVSASASAKRGGSVVASCVEQVLRRATFPSDGRGTQQIKRTLEL